jgi:Protein of unknown function, DUF547
MIKNNIWMLVLSLLVFQSCFREIKDYSSESKPVNHAIYDSLLRKYVNNDGFVDYKGFIKDSVQFNSYLDLLSKNHPNDKNWSREERLAYWINAYNAFTIKLICKNYPIASIKDIKKGLPFVSDTWTIDFIKIEGKVYSLNNIEHNIIRPKFKEPRIHFAINCASYSCAPLRNEAFMADKLEAQLDDVAKKFINANSFRNKIVSSKKGELSKYFTWFAGDFKEKEPSVIAFINKYADIKLDENASIDYVDYNWNLNEQKAESMVKDK